jgi:hypothetical protein
MVDDSILLHRLGQRLANGQMWPQWSQDSEFRAVRDRSAGDRAAPQAQPAADPPSGERG